MHNYLDFEKPISDLEGKIHELKKLKEEDESIDTSDEVGRLEVRAREAMADIYSKLTPWQKTQVARHPQRPHFLDYARQLFEGFTPLAGDRKFAEDEAIQAGLGRFRGEAVAVIGQEKGSDTKSRLKHNFGSARPEGYRKAIRVMEMADRFGLPVITLDAWRWLEVGSGVPLIEAATVDQFVPQMVNLELIGGVDFQKGCYPGQEVVARSQYRGTLKRRMFLFDVPAEARAGQEIFHSADPGQPAGLVANAAPAPNGGARLLAEVKLAALDGGSLHLGATDGPLLVRRELPYTVPAEAAEPSSTA